MEIQSFNDGLITTVEVLTLLRERTRARKKVARQSKPSVPKNRDWVEKEVIKYLKATSAKGATLEQVSGFLAALDDFCKTHGVSLTMAEQLQLIDVMPILPVEVHLVIEECDERLQEEHVEALLQVVNTHLIAPFEQEEGGGEDGMTVAETVEGDASTIVTGGAPEEEEEEAPRDDEEDGGVSMQGEDNTEFVAEAASTGREEDDE